MTDLGTDIDFSSGDLDPLFGLVTGRPCLAQAIAHRLSTPRGSLLDDPNYGLDVRAKVGESWTPSSLFAFQAAIAAEAMKDERVLRATAAVTLEGRTLTIQLALEDGDGPFQLTMAVSNLTVDILSVTA